MLLNKTTALAVLNEGLATGADYAEIYVEETKGNNLTLENGLVESLSASSSIGVGIRLLLGTRMVYGHTSDLSKASLCRLARDLSASFSEERKFTVASIKKERVKVINKFRDPLDEVPTETKIAYLREVDQAMKGVDARLVRRIAIFSNVLKRTEVYNAEGEEAHLYPDLNQRGRLIIEAFAQEGDNLQTAFAGPGRCDGWHYFTQELDYKGKARQVAEKAIRLLSAKDCPSGIYTVVIANGWGGVLFHESCGHSLEAEATSRGLSVFSESLGKQIASPLVTAYDDGTIPNEWGSNNIDSEGHKTQKNLLIEKGICKGFMVDRLSARRFEGKLEANGTARRQSYKYAPVSRMSNTYIAAGKDDPKDIIADTKLGIYVADFGGGSVQPTTGEFNFAASEAYIIRDGKIAEPVKGCICIGSGKDVLMNIDRVGNDLALGQGNCGASSGLISVNVGQPTIRIQNLVIGGNGGKLE